MKSYTDLEQSKNLAEILPLESADMGYVPSAEDDNGNTLYTAEFKSEFIFSEVCIPCWSLASLLDVLPFPNLFYNDGWNLYVTINDKIININNADNPIDAAFEMVCWLKENNKL